MNDLRQSTQMRECYRCHRVGYQSFVPFGDYGWVCKNERACDKRKRDRVKGR